MAKIDQSTRRGRLVTVFIGGLLIFGLVTLAGFYLSNQRRIQFEAAQNGDSSQVTNLDDSSEEITDENGQDGTSTENDDESQAQEEVESVATTGPSDDEEGQGSGSSTIPTTGPSDIEGTPGEIPATGPETFWIVAIIGGLVVTYIGFEYRRSRTAFQRAALRRQ